MSSILKILVDTPCRIYCDYEDKGDAIPNSIFRLPLRKGIYILEFKIDGDVIYSLEYSMQSNDEEDLLKINLFIHIDETLFLKKGNYYHSIFREYNIILLHHKQPDYFVAEKEGKYGVIDKYGRCAIPLLYKEILIGYKRFIVAINLDNKYGILNYDNKIILPFVYDEIMYSDDKDEYFVRIGNKWGVCDKSGATRIDVVYEKLGEYTDSIYMGPGDYDNIPYCIVKRNGKYGVIDTDLIYRTDFKEIIPCIYDCIYLLSGNRIDENESIDRILELIFCGSPFGGFVFVKENILAFPSYRKFNEYVSYETLKECAIYDEEGNITREFACNSFNYDYKILNGKFIFHRDVNAIQYDNISEIISYDGTWDWVSIADYNNGHCQGDNIQAWNYTSYYCVSKGKEHNIIKKYEMDEMDEMDEDIYLSITGDEVIEFYRNSLTYECYAILKIDELFQLLIYDGEGNLILKSPLMKEIYSNYNARSKTNEFSGNLMATLCVRLIFILKNIDDKYAICIKKMGNWDISSFHYNYEYIKSIK